MRGSSALVGSSKRIARGLIASARAIATRCCCPPESARGRAVILSPSPTRLSKARARASASSADRPRTWIGASVTFRSAFRCGNRLNPWKTMPTVRQTCRTTAARAEPVVSASTSRPSTTTLPPWNRSRPLRQRKKVLLPPPEVPMIAATSPLRNDSDTPRRTSSRPCRLTRSRVSIRKGMLLVLMRVHHLSSPGRRAGAPTSGRTTTGGRSSPCKARPSPTRTRRRPPCCWRGWNTVSSARPR